MRAFLRVNRQSMVTRLRFILRFQALASGRRSPSEGILRWPRHCRENRLISISAWFSQLPCFTVHYTPKHGSWLNQAEIEISLFSRQCLGQRRIPSLGDLRPEARAWNRRMNRNRVTIDWRFTRRKARMKFGYKRNQIMRSET